MKRYMPRILIVIAMIFAGCSLFGWFTGKTIFLWPPKGKTVRPGESFIAAAIGPPLMTILSTGGDTKSCMLSPCVVIIKAPDRIGSEALSAVAKWDPATQDFKGDERSFIVDEGADTGGDLQTQSRYISLAYPGQGVPIEVSLNQDGKSINLAASSRIHAASADAEIASVKKEATAYGSYRMKGMIVVAGAKKGKTTVTVTLNNLTQDISVENRWSGVPGDLNGDGKVDQDDVAILMTDLSVVAPTINAAVTRHFTANPGDARDLNHDGIVDAKDVELLKKLCALPDCAIPAKSGTAAVPSGVPSNQPPLSQPPSPPSLPRL